MQSVKSDLQSLFHQYDDIQESFFQGDVSSFGMNARDSYGKTLLHYACEYGLTEGVSILLANNAQRDVCDEKGYTPLHYACQNNHIHYDICKIVIQRHPYYLILSLTQGGSGSRSNVKVVTSQDECSRTILHYACIHGDFDVLHKLLKAGADPCAQDKLGNNPMHYACENGHLQCVQRLIVTSRNPNGLLQIPNNDGVTPLFMKTHSGGTILHIACEKCDVCVVAKLLEAGADTNLSDVFGFTPLSVRTDCGGTILHAACDKKNINLVIKLLDAGADPNVRDEFGFTPLMRGIVSTRKLGVTTDVVYSIISALCYSKCSVNAAFVPSKPSDSNNIVHYCEGSTALHMAIDKLTGDQLCVRELVINGAALDARDVHGRTPLHIAIIRGYYHLIKFLAPSPESVLFKDYDGCTPLHYACKNFDLECVREFMVQIPDDICDLMEVVNEYGATPLSVRGDNDQTILHVACIEGDFPIVDKVLQAGADPNITDRFGCTPLYYACANFHFECVRKFFVHIPDVICDLMKVANNDGTTPLSVRTDSGETILHVACKEGDLPIVKKVLEAGADPNVQDNNGATPLMSALHHHRSYADMNLLSLLLSLDWKPDIKDNCGRTALHYSAKCDDIQIPLMLISAGCDLTAVDNYGQRFSDLISKESLQLIINKQLLRIDRRHIICVVGYPKCGKTTIIAAFQQAQQNRGTFQRLSDFFQNTIVTVADSRTAGIDTKVITTEKLGSLIFFDFAGQSEYYASHLAFLESALSAKSSTITFIMMVDLRCSEEDRKIQCKEWLFPIKTILKDHNMLNVILIGSHLDQVGSLSTSTSSIGDTLMELKRTLGTPQMQFIDCWEMDCRQLSSKGMTNLRNYLQLTHPTRITSVDSSQVPLGACLLFDTLKKSENPPLAITPSKIIDKLKDGRPPFPLTVKYIDSYCQDLAASGLVLYIPNREDPGESWLILEMEEILSRIHGKLFAPDSAEFPMHHKNLANQFGLVHVEELTLAFNDSPLDPEMVQKLLTAMEFCHPIDSSLMTKGILDVLFLKVSCDLCGNLLFFPSLVKANEEPVVLTTKSDIPGDDCHWMCWELSTVKPHFLHPRFQQAVFIRLACNHVQKHKSDFSTVEEHSCTVSKNAMSWSTIHGVDVCVQIMHKSTIKVLARSRPGVKVSSLMEMFSSVVSDVLTVRANHAPGVDAYSVFRVMEKGTAGEHSVPVSSIIEVVQAGGMYVNSRERPPKLVSLKDLFLDWEISVTLLEKMVSISKINCDIQAPTEDVRENTHSGPVTIDKHYYESQKLILSDVYSALIAEDVLVSKWQLFAHHLKIERGFIQVIEEAIDSSSRFWKESLKDWLYHLLEAWLSEEEGTGDLPRTWDTIVTALESSSISTVAENLRRQIGLADSNTPQDIGSSKQKSPSGDEEQRTTVCAPGPGPDKPTTKHDVISLLIIKDDLIRLIGLKTCVKWIEFSLYLGIDKNIRDEVSHNCHRVAKDCFIEVFGRWLSHEDGTGDNPRTWGTVFSALRDMGQSHLVEEVKAELFPTTVTEDNLPTLLDDVDYVVRAQHKVPESDLPQEDEDCGPQPNQKCTLLKIKPTEADLLRLVGSQMCAKWNTFAVYLGIEKHIRDEVSYKCLREPKDCFIEVVGQWLSREDGTGDSPRTWETVFSALREMGFILLVNEVTQKLSKRLETSQQ